MAMSLNYYGYDDNAYMAPLKQKSYNVKISQEDKVLMINDDGGLLARIGIEFDAATHTLSLIGKEDNTFIDDVVMPVAFQSVSNISYNKDSGEIQIMFLNTDGSLSEVTLDIDEVVASYKAGNGIEISSDNVINVKVKDGDKYLTASDEGLSVEVPELADYYTKDDIDEMLSGLVSDHIKHLTVGDIEFSDDFGEDVTLGISGANVVESKSFIHDGKDLVSQVDAIESLLNDIYTKGEVNQIVAESELVISASLNDLNTRKLDASAYTQVDLSEYYTKAEVDAKDKIRVIECSARILGDVNGDNVITIADSTLASQRVTQGHSDIDDIYFDVNEDGIISIGDVSLIISIILGRNLPKIMFTVNPFSEVKECFENGKIPVLHFTLGGREFNLKVDSVDKSISSQDGEYVATALYNLEKYLLLTVVLHEDKTVGTLVKMVASQDLSNYYTKSEVDGMLEEIGTLNDYYTKEETDEKVDELRQVVIDNELTVSSAINDLNEKKLDASAYTETDLTDYYNKSQVDNLINAVETSLNDYYTKGEVDSIASDIISRIPDESLFVKEVEFNNAMASIASRFATKDQLVESVTNAKNDANTYTDNAVVEAVNTSKEYTNTNLSQVQDDLNELSIKFTKLSDGIVADSSEYSGGTGLFDEIYAQMHRLIDGLDENNLPRLLDLLNGGGEPVDLSEIINRLDSIETQIDTINNRLDEIEYVTASALTNLNESLGFNSEGQFESSAGNDVSSAINNLKNEVDEIREIIS